MSQVCMASHMNREQYGTGLYGQSHESCKVWHRSAWPVTRIVNSMAQVCMASHMNREQYGTGLYGQSHESWTVWHRSIWPVT